MPNTLLPKSNKTQQVIQWVQEKIHWQVYKPNDKIPSVRETAKLLGVSPFTVTQAFEILVMQGIIVSRQGSGYYVCSTKHTGTAVTNGTPKPHNSYSEIPVNVLDTSWLLSHLFHTAPPELSSGSGLMPDSWLYPRQPMLQATKKATTNISFVYGYGHIQGYQPLREQFAVQLAECGISADPNHMVTTAGVSAGIELVVRTLCQAGDTVLVDDPTWFWIIGCLQQMGIKVIGVNRGRQQGENQGLNKGLNQGQAGIDKEELEQLLQTHRPKIYITNSVLHNPTSLTITPQEVFDVLKLMEQYDCYVIEDDIYGNFVADKRTLRYATLDNFQRVFYLSGVSKVLGGNWRVGIVCSPKAHLPALLRQKMLSNMTCPEISERTVLQIWQSPQYKKYLTQVNHQLAVAHQSLRHKLTAIGLDYPPDTNVNLFIWLDVGVDTSELALQAHKEGWLVAPGHLFSPVGKHKTFIRLNVTRTSDEFLAWLGDYLTANPRYD